METQHSAMKFQILVLILLLACMYPSVAQGSYENCCLKYIVGVRKNMRRNIVSYRVQETDGGCNIPAIVFKLKKQRTLCADPKQSWVQELMQKIDKKNTGTK
ncbi:C-C motif chemokine 25b [Ctenopharyngodon idella]|uniref:Chemokine ligand 25b n=1 Tax=Ctenopharyngodon idella TaxID=7959 RepID=A0A345D701_CTEID|nr:C-C motif chemokine 25b [Ctenopharyngodon idella]AXF84131.1 chemokine ligand 25b [Ctenopharyngodon idella]